MARRSTRSGASQFAKTGETTVFGRKIGHGFGQPLRDQVRGQTAKTHGCKRKQRQVRKFHQFHFPAPQKFDQMALW